MSVGNYKVVCCMLAGRSEYMRLSASFILSDPAVDRFDIWFNPYYEEDVGFLEELSETFPEKIKLIKKGKIHKGNFSKFYIENATDEDTIYVKIDDDIVWMDRGTIGNIAQFQADNPNYFLTSPAVINNAGLVLELIKQGKVHLSLEKITHCISDESRLAEVFHRKFIDKIEKTGLEDMYFEPISFRHYFSIHMIAFLGKTMKSVTDKYGSFIDDEQWLSYSLPKKIDKDSCLYGKNYIAHLMYGYQTDLDIKNILENYVRLNEKMGSFDKDVYEKISALANKHLKARRFWSFLGHNYNYEIAKRGFIEAIFNIRFIFVSRYERKIPGEARAERYKVFNYINKINFKTYYNGEDRERINSFFYRFVNEFPLFLKNLRLAIHGIVGLFLSKSVKYPFKIEVKFGDLVNKND